MTSTVPYSERNYFNINKMTTNVLRQTNVKRRFIPIPYPQWFDSVNNKIKAVTYMSKESLKYYYMWCDYVSKMDELEKLF